MHVIDVPSRREAPGTRFALAGIAWGTTVAGAFLGVALASYFAGHIMGGATARWLGPVAMGLVAIAGSLALVWLARVKLNHRPWQDMGLPRPQPGRLLLGAISAVLVVLALAAMEYALGWLHVAPPSAGGDRGSRFLLAATALVSSFGVGFSEELVFRGYLFGTLAERMARAPAVVLTGLIFGLIHFTMGGFGIVFVVSVLLYSTMFLAMRFATGSLWFPIGFHALYDWTQTYLVGLSAPGAAQDPALIRVIQSGPAFWVGHPPAIESGLLCIGMASVVTLAMTFSGRVFCRAAAVP